MRRRVGVLLSGCGAFDGAEIHEAVLTLLYLDNAGADAVCAAPNLDHKHLLNHLTREEMGETRNILTESARIARGDIVELKKLNTEEMDALIIPGGFGAVVNLCDMAVVGPGASVLPEVSDVLEEMHHARKPIGALGMASALVALILCEHGPEVTIGKDADTAAAIKTMGGHHRHCDPDDIVVDRSNNIVTTPAYNAGQGIRQIAMGIEKLVHQVLTLTDSQD